MINAIMYKLDKERPVTIKDRTPFGDYISLDLFCITKDRKDGLFIRIKISNTFRVQNHLDTLELQRIFIKKVENYLESKNWEVNDLSITTRTVCSGPSCPDNGIVLQTTQELRDVKLEDMII